MARGGGAPAAATAPGFALDALAGTGAAAFAALLLWTLVGFIGLPATPGVLGVLLGAAAVAFVVAGPHPGGRHLRLRFPAALAAALLLWALGRAVLSGGASALVSWAATASAQFGAWGTGTAAGLDPPAAYVAATAAGLGVCLPVFHAARTGRPAVALLLGFALLVVEWEFVDDATVRLFWPLVTVALFWLAADRARETARGGELQADGPTPWTAFGMAGVAGGVVALGLLVLPRQGAPANLGALGVWIDQLPLVGTIEKATRQGSMGYGGGPAAPGGGGGSRPGTAAPASVRTDGFTLAQTGFTSDVSQLGGPAQPDARDALILEVSGTPDVPPVLYLRGATRERYDGHGWLPTPDGQAPDPGWPATSAGPIGRDFLRGEPLPAPYRQVSVRIQLREAPGVNLFTLLLPLRLPVLGVSWDQSGEVWPAAPPASGFTYSLTAAVLGTDVYAGTALASYHSPARPGVALSPLEAEALAAQGLPVAADPVAPELQNPGAMPLADDLELPVTLPLRVRELARLWTRRVAGDPLLEALAVQEALRGGFTYTLQAPAAPARGDFVDFFLFTARRGYCTSYSTAMVVLLRSLGIPARWVEGYRVAVPPAGGTFRVRNEDAHAWVEAYIPPFGWLTFDPTPGTAPPALPLTDASRGAGGGAPRGLLAEAGALGWWALGGAPALFLLLLAGNATVNVLAERRPAGGPLEQALVLWRACERVGARYGCPRRPHLTPEEYAAELGARYPAAAAAAASLARAYGRLRYGPPGDPAALGAAAQTLQASWRELQARLRAASPLTYPLRRWL